MEHIYQHFRKEEQNFVDQVLDWKNEVINDHKLKLTDFLDPREQMIVKTIIGKSDQIHYDFWGGSDSFERKRALLYPPYYEIEKADFQLQCFELTYPSKFITLKHRDVLGALMSLGIKREKFGDIIVGDEMIQLIVAKEISSFVSVNFSSVGQAKIKLKPISEEELKESREQWKEKTITASSLRLDAVIAEIYQLSRAKARMLIEKGSVKVNWQITEDASFQLEAGDVISVSKYGRSKLLLIEGNTKKGKYRIKIGRK